MPTDFEIARQKFREWWQREHGIIDISTNEGKQKHYSSEVGFLAGYMQCLDDIWAIKKAYDKCQNRDPFKRSVCPFLWLLFSDLR